MEQRRYEIGHGRTRLEISVMRMGNDLAVFVNGGESHVGSVAIGVSRPSLDDPSRLSSTTSIFNVVGHKDDYLARPLADELAAATGRTAVVVAGVHLPAITPAEIEEVMHNLRAAIRLLKEEWGKGRLAVSTGANESPAL